MILQDRGSVTRKPPCALPAAPLSPISNQNVAVPTALYPHSASCIIGAWPLRLDERPAIDGTQSKGKGNQGLRGLTWNDMLIYNMGADD
jgi:hypothetical protein